MMGSYQLSFDDLERAKLFELQPGRTAYIDESGSFGFDFGKDVVSTHYIVCVLLLEMKKLLKLSAE